MAVANSKVAGIVVSDDALGLESTVGKFADRIARKLKEQGEAKSEAERAADLRKTLILEAMTTIRKALQETLHINLGERFFLDLDIDDWESWPRVQLSLIDSLDPDNINHALAITANDRLGDGRIDIALKGGKVLARANMTSRQELSKLSLLLKKSVRDFLEIVAAYILNPVKPENILAVETKPIETEEPDMISKELRTADVFEEPISSRDNFVAQVTTVQPVDISD